MEFKPLSLSIILFLILVLIGHFIPPNSQIKKDKINVFYVSADIHYECGFGVVDSELYEALKQDKRVNLIPYLPILYKKKYQHGLRKIFYKLFPVFDKSKITDNVIKNTDIYFSVSPANIEIVNFMKRAKELGNNKIKYYSVWHDGYEAIRVSKDIPDAIDKFDEKERLEHFRSKIDTKKWQHAFEYENLDGIFIVSKTSKKDLDFFIPEVKNTPKYIITWPILERKISKDLFPNYQAKKISNSLDKDFILKNKYFLAHAGKDVLPVIEAVKKLREKTKQDVKLVIYGNLKSGIVFNFLNKGKLAKLDLDQNKDKYKDFIYFTGFISNEDLDFLMENALAYITINAYEGFGMELPIFLKKGIPLVVSDSGAHKEVVEGGAYILKNKSNCKKLKYFSENFISEGTCQVDINDLVDVLGKISSDDVFKKNLKIKAKNLYNKKYQDLTWAKLANHMVDIWGRE